MGRANVSKPTVALSLPGLPLRRPRPRLPVSTGTPWPGNGRRSDMTVRIVSRLVLLLVALAAATALLVGGLP